MSVFGALDVSATGMTAQQLRMDTISENIANVNTTRAKDGKPYKRKTVLFEEKSYPSFSESLSMANRHNIGKGVKASKIVEDNSEGSKVYDPSHPDADLRGAGTAGVVASGLDAAGQGLGGVGVKAPDIISLPAVQGDGHGL